MKLSEMIELLYVEFNSYILITYTFFLILISFSNVDLLNKLYDNSTSAIY